MGALVLADPSWKPWVPSSVRSFWNLAAWITAACLLSYFVLTLYALKFEVGLQQNGKSTTFGIAQLYRLLQVLIVFKAATSFSLTHNRLVLIKRVALLTFILVCGGVFATYSGLITTQDLGARISKDFNVAGPWAYYSTGIVDQGVGSISYNHAYTAMQVLLSGAVVLVLNARVRRNAALTALIPLIMTVTCFVSGSRAGFLVAIMVAICVSGLRVQSMYAWVSIGVLVMSLSIFGIDTISAFQQATDRQGSSTDSYQEDGLSGRTQMWSDRMDFMNSEPRHWLVGAGFGSTIETGNNAHNLFLQLLIEGGALAVAVFLYLQFRIIRLLLNAGEGARPLLWMNIALLTTCFTQETFYPVPAFPHFLGFFFAALALSITKAAPLKLSPAKALHARRPVPCFQ
jgi:hypothetical protein